MEGDVDIILIPRSGNAKRQGIRVQLSVRVIWRVKELAKPKAAETAHAAPSFHIFSRHCRQHSLYMVELYAGGIRGRAILESKGLKCNKDLSFIRRHQLQPRGRDEKRTSL